MWCGVETQLFVLRKLKTWKTKNFLSVIFIETKRTVVTTSILVHTKQTRRHRTSLTIIPSINQYHQSFVPFAPNQSIHLFSKTPTKNLKTTSSKTQSHISSPFKLLHFHTKHLLVVYVQKSKPIQCPD